MTEQEVLAKMKEAEAAAERGPGHIKVTYTYPLKLTAANPGGHNQAKCYRESVDSLMVGVHTNNMKYAKDNYAATGQKVSKCPNGFDYPTNKDEQGYFWIRKADGSYYVRAKFENIAAQYKQRSKYFIDGVEVTYQDLEDAYMKGEFEKSALAVATDRDLFDRHVAVDRITDIKVLVKEELGEAVNYNKDRYAADMEDYVEDLTYDCLNNVKNALFSAGATQEEIDATQVPLQEYLDMVVDLLCKYPNEDMIQEFSSIYDVDDEYTGMEQ